MEHLRIKSAVNANLQNTINTSLILHYVRRRGPSWRSEISRELSLSLPAVSRAVDYLLKQGFFIEKRIITASGKQAHEIEIDSSLGVSIGISVELPYIRIGRLDMAGKLTTLNELELASDARSLEEQLTGLIDLFLSRREEFDGKVPPVVAICLSIPAAVESDRRQVHAVLYRSMRELDLCRLLEDRYHVPVFLENNENLCVLAEKYYEEGIPEEDIAFVTVHHGIGAGLLLNGQIYRGRNGAAGEIGQQHIAMNPYSGEGYSETFETIASIHQIQQIALKTIHRGLGEDLFQAADYKYQNITHNFVSDLAVRGSASAREILVRYAEVLAIGISTMLVTINPELVILGGRLCEMASPEKFIIAPLKSHLEKLVPFPVPDIRMTRLGQHASVIGACQLALENTILRQYPYIIDR